MDQGSIDALYQSFKDAAEQGSIDALYQSFKAAEQRRTDILCQSLRDAAKQGSIDALYALIRTNSDVLDSMDKIPIVETPLHIAASLGHTEFAMEIMKLKPSFARKLNQDGFTPMHLALQKLHELENDDALQRNLTQLVHQLLDVEKDLVRVKGKEGVTPLHYVAQMRNLHFFAKFLKACPESLEDVTIRGENVLHIALKYNKDDKGKSFWLLVQWLQRAWFKDANLLGEKLLYWQDEEGNTLLHVDDKGNTLLHVAVSKNQPEVVQWLLNIVADLNVKNLDQDNQQIKDMLMRPQRLTRCATLLLYPSFLKISRAIRRQQTVLTEERRNALLVVATLLITVTYQAALGPDQPPNRFNCTAPINATAGANLFNCTAWFNANSTDVNSSPHQGVAFYFINTITYYLTNVTLLVLLPPNFIAVVLYYLLGLLFLCYCISTPLLNAPLLSTIGICLLPSFPIFGLLSTGRAIFTNPSKILPYTFLGMLSAGAIILKWNTPETKVLGAKLGFV